MSPDQIQLLAAIHNNATIVNAQNEETGEIDQFYKLGKCLINMQTLKNAGAEWIEQPRYISRKTLLMYLCGSALALFIAVSLLGK